MTTIYDLIQKIKNFLHESEIIQTVTFGDISEIDLTKTTIYPLTHFMIADAIFRPRVIELKVSFLFLDVVHQSKEYSNTEEEDSNLIDVYNTQLVMANDLISHLRRGDLFDDKYQLVNDPAANMFKDRFENQLAGWSVDVDIQIPNNLSICQ